jgi:hypothetical protein
MCTYRILILTRINTRGTTSQGLGRPKEGPTT